MAENRTFQFIGLGYGTTDATITAKVNNTVVYSGAVPTVDQPLSPLPEPAPSDLLTLFEIPNSSTLNTDFAGSLPMTVEVTGGTGVLFSLIQCNYYSGDPAQDPNCGQPDKFSYSYTGNPTNSEGTVDPRSSVKIDGVTQVPPLAASLGCWTWVVPAGSTLSYNWNISIGQVGNVVGDTGNYSGPYTTTAPTP